MSTQNDKKEILAAFGPSENLTDDVVEKLSTFKQIFNLNTDDLFINWETFNVTKVKQDLELNLTNLDRFQEYLQEIITVKTPQIKREKNLVSSSTRKQFNPLTPNKKRKVEEETPYKTPLLKIESSPSYETANSTFNSSPTKKVEKESNTVLETLNPENDEVGGYEDSSIRPFKLIANFEKSKYQFRTMQMKLLESADVLDDQIDSFAQLYQQSNKSDTDFGNPCLSSQFDILCSGRIVPDSTDYTNQLNSSSLFLETSRMAGIGQRIPLDLTHLSTYSFFPGQIVILKGKNPTGNVFIVEEILSVPELSSPVSTKAELQEYEEINKNGLKVVVMSGPYSNGQNLNFKKLDEFTSTINNEIKPHVVIMNGPFIDITNESVKNGEIDAEYRNLDELFKGIFTPILKKIDSKIQIILIPSIKDTSIKHCSYPQDSFDKKKFGLTKNIRVYPNPTNFLINEANFAISNLDIFKDLSEVSSRNQVNTRLDRIVHHVFEQRRFYPIFPGSIKRIMKSDDSDDLNEGLLGSELNENDIGGSTLEVPYLGLSEFTTSLPDILIIPSELKFFAKVIKGVLVINPGFYIRGNRDPAREEGSYSVLHIQPPSTEGVEDNVELVDEDLELYYHNIFKRSRVDMYKS